MGQKGGGLGHVTYFSNFGTPLISPEWLKIQISNFSYGLKVSGECFSDFQSESPCKGAHGFTSQWS